MMFMGTIFGLLASLKLGRWLLLKVRVRPWPSMSPLLSAAFHPPEPPSRSHRSTRTVPWTWETPLQRAWLDSPREPHVSNTSSSPQCSHSGC